MFEQDALRGDLEQRSGRGWTASAVGAEKVFYTLQQPTELSPACTGKSNFICNVFYGFTLYAYHMTIIQVSYVSVYVRV